MSRQINIPDDVCVMNDEHGFTVYFKNFALAHVLFNGSVRLYDSGALPVTTDVLMFVAVTLRNEYSEFLEDLENAERRVAEAKAEVIAADRDLLDLRSRIK